MAEFAEHGFIVQHVSASFEVKAEREFVASALQLILGMQFVSNSFDPDSRRHTIYKVEQGSGIGMKHAGAVSDWLFWRAVERIVLKEPDLGVSCCLRFRDDLFVLLDDIRYSPIFRSRITATAAAYCSVSLESYSLVGVPFF